LVALAIVVQCLPGIVGVLIFGLAQSGKVLQGGVEIMLFAVAVALLVILSLYWAASSLLALIIVTLPQMYPWRALQIAGELAVGRRWSIAFRVVVLALTVYVVWVAVLIPMIMLDSWLKFDWLPLLPATVLALGGFTMIYISTYIYKMYRSLL
jgi:hypothetical protein